MKRQANGGGASAQRRRHGREPAEKKNLAAASSLFSWVETRDPIGRATISANDFMDLHSQ